MEANFGQVPFMFDFEGMLAVSSGCGTVVKCVVAGCGYGGRCCHGCGCGPVLVCMGVVVGCGSHVSGCVLFAGDAAAGDALYRGV